MSSHYFPAKFGRALIWAALTILASHTALAAPTPQWIWDGNDGEAPADGETRYFRKKFAVTGKVEKAVLAIAANDEGEIFINNNRELTAKGYANGSYADVTSKLKFGENLLAVRGKAGSTSAGLVVRLEITYSDKKKTDVIVTDGSWSVSPKSADKWNTDAFKPGTNWVTATKLGKLGVKPWGNALALPKATPVEKLTVLPGFKVQLLRSAQITEGSWICMTTDDQGRLIISPQKNEQPLLRVTLSKSGQIEKIEPIPAPIRQAMGLLYAHNSLYANCDGPEGVGLYRLVDANHNDVFDKTEVRFLKKIAGQGEHGYHALVEGPDGMIYMMNGNHTKVPEGVVTNSPHRNYQEDFLLPRQWDANGHAVGILAPGGYVVRTDAEGKTWELICGGFRNSYDFDFNPEGEMFTFDSDMEWDWGLPWYRPTRINHCVTGGEFGWRSGSAVWPEYYADSLPAAVNIGIGSPTGVKFGTKSSFPGKYKKALFIMDWSYGRIMAVHLKAQGASYEGTFENFVQGKPLNVTDMVFGNDGAMYFITGGRGTQSGLYRVTYTGNKYQYWDFTDANSPEEKAATEARATRHMLEKFHGKQNPEAVAKAWPYMGSADRFLRFAARIAVESQPVDEWKDKALAETNPEAALNALLALARCGGKETQTNLLMALKSFPLDKLTEAQKLTKLRVIELSFIRQGKPDPAFAELAISKLDAQYPAASEWMNRELTELLIYLEAPNAVSKTMALLAKAPTQEEQVHEVFYLRNSKTGWTADLRRQYYEWFVKRGEGQQTKDQVTYPGGSAYQAWADQDKAKQMHPASMLKYFTDVGREYGDGASFNKYLQNIRKDAAQTLSEDEKKALGTLVDKSWENTARAQTKERKFVREWKVSDIEPSLDKVGKKRDFASARAAFNDAQCLSCHRFGNEGGSIGPELTAASSKYSRRDILEAILEPSKVVSEQFQNEVIVKKDGDDVSGRVVDENDQRIIIMPSPLAPDTKVEVKKADIAKREPSKVSPMPEGLLNNLTRDEILDLLAYIEAMGKPKAENFTKAKGR